MSEEKPTMPQDAAKPRRRFSQRRKIITGGVIAALVATPFVINEITPRPYAGILRALIGQIESSVELGPYADDIEEVTASDPITIPVDGAPDAGMTVYTSGDTGAPKPVILLIHGGGWVVGSASQIGEYAQVLAAQGFVVANLSYSLAPEYRYPTPIQQSAAALDYLHDHAADFGGDGSKLFLGGNSAGAQIAGQLAAVATNAVLEQEVGVNVTVPGEQIRGVLLYSGPYDFDTVKRAEFPGFRTYAWSYTGQKNWQEYSRLDELSITQGATADYPATYMTSGDADPLELQTYELDAVLRAKDVNVTSRYWTGSGLDLPHDYIYDLTTEAGRTALNDTVQFVAEKSR